MADPNELLDVVDPATGAVLETLDRATVHREGRWHQVFHCLVVRPAHGTVVLQERAPTKSFPGKLDLSVTGHLSAGEQPIDGIREAREELGIDLEPKRLVALGTRLLTDSAGEGHNCERMHVFLYDDDRELTDYAPDPAEVTALVEVGVSDLLHTFATTEATSEPARGLRWTPDRAPAPFDVSSDQLVQGTDGYWIVLLTMALRHLRGEVPLAI
ncbi:MAG: NUDIX domain-containing protein [Acidimicrobiales bacterium]